LAAWKEQMEKILNRLKTENFRAEDLVELLKIKTQEEFAPVFELSDSLCRRYFQDKVYVRGIIEFSNECRKNCCYCGIRKENSNIKRYTMPKEEILSVAEKIYNDGVHTVVLQSGENPESDAMIMEVVARLKEKFNMAVTLSVGERPESVYRQFKEAGADRYLLRIETTDEKLFSELHPDDDLKFRMKCLRVLKGLGYEAGTGIMVGLPGQSIESIVNDLFFFREFRPGMIGIGPFLPHEDTPLKEHKRDDIFLTLKVLALIRIMNPEVNLPATTAMGTIDQKGREKALKIAANVIMPNFTPLAYRGSYKLYDKKICNSEVCTSACTARIIKDAGKVQVTGIGSSLVK